MTAHRAQPRRSRISSGAVEIMPSASAANQTRPDAETWAVVDREESATAERRAPRGRNPRGQNSATTVTPVIESEGWARNQA